MSRKLLSQLLIVGVCSLSVPFGFALSRDGLPVTPTATTLSGTLLTRTDQGSAWTQADEVSKGKWFKTTDGEAVVAMGGGVQVRMARNTVLHVESSTNAMVNLQVDKGQVFTSVPTGGKTPVSINTPSGRVSSASGSFILDVKNGKTNLEVLQGNAVLQGTVSSDRLGGELYSKINLQAGDDAESSEDNDQDPGENPEMVLPVSPRVESVENLIAQSSANEQRILQGTVENLTDQGFELVLSDGTRIQVNVDGKTKFYDKDSGEELNDLANGDTVEVVWENPDAEVAVEVRIGRDKFPIGATEGTTLGLGAFGAGLFLALQGDGQDNGDDVIIASP